MPNVEVIVRLGTPKIIHSDQGKQLEWNVNFLAKCVNF